MPKRSPGGWPRTGHWCRSTGGCSPHRLAALHGRPNGPDGAIVLVSEDPVTPGLASGLRDRVRRSGEQLGDGDVRPASRITFTPAPSTGRTGSRSGGPPHGWPPISLGKDVGRRRWSWRVQPGGAQPRGVPERVVHRHRHPGRRVRPGAPDRAGAAELIRLEADGGGTSTSVKLVVHRGGERRSGRGRGCRRQPVRRDCGGCVPSRAGFTQAPTTGACSRRSCRLKSSLRRSRGGLREASLGYDVVSRRGGFDLWRSDDGDAWHAITPTASRTRTTSAPAASSRPRPGCS